MKTNDQYGSFNGPAEVRIVRLLPGPIERVWEYLTDSEKRGRWLASGPMEPRVGGKVTLNYKNKDLSPGETPPEGFEEKNEKGHTMHVTVTRWEPPRVLGYTFGSDNESEVIFELTSQGKQVQLVLTHRATAGDLPYMTLFASGWHVHVSHLIAQLENAPRPPFWPQFVRVKAEYDRQHAALKA
jgi:uncharacterized protein YndB with AHSA1/START domain